MIDANWHPWYIESNGYPGYTWSINFDTRGMVEDQFNLVQQVSGPRSHSPPSSLTARYSQQHTSPLHTVHVHEHPTCTLPPLPPHAPRSPAHEYPTCRFYELITQDSNTNINFNPNLPHWRTGLYRFYPHL